MHVISDHDPRPLHMQIESRYPEEFGWEYLETGPEVLACRNQAPRELGSRLLRPLPVTNTAERRLPGFGDVHAKGLATLSGKRKKWVRSLSKIKSLSFKSPMFRRN